MDFFDEYIWKTLLDWPIGTILGVIMIALVVFLLLLAGYGMFTAIDSWLLPTKKGQSVVTSKWFTPAHTSIILIYDATTKTNMPYPVFYSDDWSVQVVMDGKRGSISVNQNFFNTISEGARADVKYVTGRLSGKIYLKSISRT